MYELREKWSHVAIEAEAIQHALELVLATNADPPPSLTEVAKELGCESLTLYKCHRTAALAISARYKAYTQVRTATRRHNYRVELRGAAMHLWERGVPVTRGRMESLLAHPGMLRDPKIRQQLLEVCREMEEKTAAERSSANAQNHDH